MKKEVIEVKVLVKLKNGQDLWGIMYLKENERIQDLLNDSRAFIPITKMNEDRDPRNTVTNTTVVINKTSIFLIEER